MIEVTFIYILNTVIETKRNFNSKQDHIIQYKKIVLNQYLQTILL